MYSYDELKFNPQDSFKTVTVEHPPSSYLDDSAYLAYQTIKTALNRSKSNWIFIIGDAAYVKNDLFLHYFDQIKNFGQYNSVYMTGGCVEQRFFSQMFTVSSGIFISRQTAKILVEQEDMWKVAFDTALIADEAIGEIMDSIGIYAKWSISKELLGMPFRHRNMYDNILNGKLDKLPPCIIPKNIIEAPSGVSTICHTDIVKFKDVVIWGGAPPEEEEFFLRNAEKMIEAIPNNVSFYWDRRFPQLCRNV